MLFCLIVLVFTLAISAVLVWALLIVLVFGMAC